MADGRLIAPDEVFREVEKDDILGRWSRSHKRMFKRLEQQQADQAREVTKRFPGLAKPGRFGPAADPFVIAVAYLEHQKRSETLIGQKGRCVVVTEEGGGPQQIPAACAHYQIPCLTLVGLIQNEGWVFR